MQKTYISLMATLLLGLRASAIVFTNDTLISPLMTNYDGLDIVISNSVLTVDGPHSFASLRAATGSTLTHSASASGMVNTYTSISDEPQLLTSTNPATLANANILPPSVIVRDLTDTITYTNNVDYTIGMSNQFTTLQRTPASFIPDGATVLVSYQFAVASTNAGLFLTINGDLEVEPGAAINVNSRGLAGGPGLGRSAGSTLSGGGGAYGGFGGLSSSNAPGGTPYGSPFEPATLGSSGGGSYAGSGGLGGGLIRLIIGGTYRLNGIATANGQDATNSRSGGGSGGSIWATAQTFSGSGTLAANGGAGEPIDGGGGGGGRIAIEFATNNFIGAFSAVGGSGWQWGGAGTVFLRTSGTTGAVTFDNSGNAGAATLLQFTNAADLTVQGRAIAAAPSLNRQTIRNLLVRSNSAIVTTTTNTATLYITVLGDAFLDQGASIPMDGRGAPANSGLGPGQLNGSVGGGGGHAGYGGFGQLLSSIANGGNWYDQEGAPVNVGSGGRSVVSSYPTMQIGGSGGGALGLTVLGNLRLDGKISVDATSGGGSAAGGGSGGSIGLVLGGLSGTGALSANGGAGGVPYGGGGSGGRIAINYSSNNFAGTMTARGGNGAGAGAAGTIYSKGDSNSSPTLVADNGGIKGTNTFILLNTFGESRVLGGAILSPYFSSLTVSHFTIDSNSTLSSGSSSTLTLNVSDRADIAGRISADGPGTTSQGIGQTSSSGSGGGGHGGYGGRGAGSLGGLAYDSASSPFSTGSRGGGTLVVAGAGGGGTLRMTVSGPLALDGRISANGIAAPSSFSSTNNGGNAGGSVWLTVGGLSGSGTIAADGGAGNLPNAGGGGGGRIAVYYTSNSFTGTFSAKGGAGFVRGGAGTIYSKANNNSVATVLVDNGGMKSTNTAVSASGTFDVVIQNGGTANALGSVRDLLVHSNGWVAQTGTLLLRDATIDSGGGITLDGIGGDSSGTGYSVSGQGSGGAHGGYGGVRRFGVGQVYDSALMPVRNGGSGGNGSGSSFPPFSGIGGGALHLIANSLTLNGSVSASGLDGDFNSGGGAGGSLWLEITNLSGNGTISASGGKGNSRGGGGGGGRISLRYTTNLLTGPLSACGGSGFEAGGAGTIYFKDNAQPTGGLVLDNCTLSGATTPLSLTFGLAPSLTIRGGATAEMQGNIPAFSNVVISAGSLTVSAGDTNLNLAVLEDMVIASGGVLHVDSKGYSQTNGPGAGSTLSNQGSGGGYGGTGGAAASGAAGGSAYGSASQPTQRGSGGGNGSGTAIGGSEGGGAIRLTVAGQLTVDGLVSAKGGDGLQDNSGGGSGGSIWLSARKLAGAGQIAANGGGGELYNGGGGGGGRIALYSLANAFTGEVSVAGAMGAVPGNTGTVFAASSWPGLAIISNSPAGLVSNVVSQLTLEFNAAVNPASAAANDFVIVTPNGPLPSTNLTLFLPGPNTLQLSFPPLNIPGNYRIEAGPALEDLFGQPMSQVYTGAFSITVPLIMGTISDTNGQAVAGVTLQEAGGLLSATSDAQGRYSFGVPPGWSGSVMPALNTLAFIPRTRAYASVTDATTNQDYLALSTISPALGAGLQGTNLAISWYGISGVSYQALYSTNLTDWLPYGVLVMGTNGPTGLLAPVEGDPAEFFRVRANN